MKKNSNIQKILSTILFICGGAGIAYFFTTDMKDFSGLGFGILFIAFGLRALQSSKKK